MLMTVLSMLLAFQNVPDFHLFGESDKESVQALSTSVTKLEIAIKESNTWWSKALTALFSAIGGGIAALLGLFAKSWYDRRYRPILILTSDPDGGSQADVHDKSGESPARWGRIIVRNTGKKTAKKCRVILTNIRKFTDAGRLVPVNYHDSYGLHYSYGKDQEKDIMPGVKYFVDVCKGGERDTPQVQLDIEGLSFVYTNVIAEKGEYVFDVAASADETEPVKASFKLVRKGEPKHLEFTNYDE